MKFEMTRCNQCGSDMPMGTILCPSCGKAQTGARRSGSLQPRTLLAVALAAAVLLVFNWIKAPAPQTDPVTARPSAVLPSG